jgi:hypothetical protein
VCLPSYETAGHTPHVVSWLRRCRHLGECRCIFVVGVSKGSSVRRLSTGLTSGARFHVRERDVFYTITFVPETQASWYTMGPHGVRIGGGFAGKTATAAQSDPLVFGFRMREALPPHAMVRSLNTEAAFLIKLSSMQGVLLFTV